MRNRTIVISLAAAVLATRCYSVHGQDRTPGTDAFDEALAWAAEWRQVDAMNVGWFRQRNLRGEDGSIVESVRLYEETLYRWPDSFVREVRIADSAAPLSERGGDYSIEEEVLEGIAPDGRHVRRFLNMPHAEVMGGPRLIDALPKESARAPFLLARWLVEHGIMAEDIRVVWTPSGQIRGTCPSAKLEFELREEMDAWVLSEVASLTASAQTAASYDLSDFVWPEGLPLPIASKVTVAVRSADGASLPGAPLQLREAKIVGRPSDSAMTIDLTGNVVQDRRTGVMTTRAGEVAMISPPSPAAHRWGRWPWVLIATVGGVAVLAAVIFWRRGLSRHNS